MQSGYYLRNNFKNFFMQILFIAGMGFIFIAIISFCTIMFFMGTEEVVINRTFYFLVLSAKAETVFVFSQDAYISGAAGYSLTYMGDYYVALAAYPTETEAKNVCNSLAKRGKTTEILPLLVKTLYFSGKSERKEKQAVEDTVNTLLQCITLLYNTANGVDTTQYTQEEAISILKELQSVFAQLREKSVVQTEDLLFYAEKKCREIVSGVVYAKDIRYLQLYISEGIYNLQTVFDN